MARWMDRWMDRWIDRLDWINEWMYVRSVMKHRIIDRVSN